MSRNLIIHPEPLGLGGKSRCRTVIVRILVNQYDIVCALFETSYAGVRIASTVRLITVIFIQVIIREIDLPSQLCCGIISSWLVEMVIDTFNAAL